MKVLWGMLKLLFRAWSYLPLGWAQTLGGLAGHLIYACSDGYRRRFDSFIAQAAFDTPELRRRALEEAGKTLAELPWLWTRPVRETRDLVQTQDWTLVEAAQQAGQGIIFLTPHLGCFEIAAQYYAAHAPITVLYSPPEQAALRHLVEQSRQRHQLQTAPANLGGVKQLFRALRRGEAVGILPDQVPAQANEGVWAEFFQRPAYTMTLPARLAALTGARVLLAFGQRLPEGRGYRLHLSKLQLPDEQTPQQQARLINEAMERLIRTCPEQYLWAYSRYKQPLGAPPVPQPTEPEK
jgi:KDO2-lipid IV(A) lauroyltransferase